MKIIPVFLAVIILSGCSPTEPDPIGDIKFTDISPMYKKPPPQLAQISAEIVVFTIEVPAIKYDTFKQIWPKLYQKGIYYVNRDGFDENGFLLGFANQQMLPEVENMMLETDSTRVSTTYLLVTENTSDQLLVSKLHQKVELFYYTAKGQVSGMTITPGLAGLQFQIEKIPAAKGIVELIVKPFFENRMSPSQDNRTIFRPITFHCDLSPGEFVLLGPDSTESSPATLKGLFFAETSKIPKVKAYVIVCRSISD